MVERPVSRRRRVARTAIVAVSIFCLVVMALGMGDVVRAAFEAPPPVKPYDPMPRW